MKKKLTGILAFAPIILFIASIILFAIVWINHGDEPEIVGSARIGLVIIVIGMVLAVILTFAAIITFIIMACINKEFSASKKVLWVILLYLLNMFVFPIYWYKHINTKSETENSPYM